MIDYMVGDVRRGLWGLLAAVGLLLLIACANTANLFLSRATERRHEMAVRASLGASGGVLARQLLTEGLVLSLAGGALGIGLAQIGTRAIASRLPGTFTLPRVQEAGVDPAVLFFALGVTLLTGILFSLAPALQLRRSEPGSTLSAEARGPSRSTGRVRSGLVVLEVALSTILLVGAGLTARTFFDLVDRDPGLDAEGVLTARINMATANYPSSEDRARFAGDLFERLEERDDVIAAGGITFLPMAGAGAGTSFYDAGGPPPPREEWPVAHIRNVSGEYFDAMGIELLHGRSFDGSETPETAPSIVVNAYLAETLWPGESALGRRLAINWGSLDVTWEVIGVVEDVRVEGMSAEIGEAIYLAYAQATYFPWLQIAVRTRGEPTAFAPTLRTFLAGIDRALPLSQVRAMEEVVHESVARPRMTATLMGLFGGLAALLAAIGLYGVLSWTVARRVREIGLRMAIGADGGRVLNLVVRQGMGLVVVGLAVGTVLAWAGSELLQSRIPGIPAGDPLVLLAAPLFLFVISLAACGLPAWRATRVAPAEALRDG